MIALTFVGLFVLAFAGGNGSGWLLGHKRAYAECCECCTCALCDPTDVPRPAGPATPPRGTCGQEPAPDTNGGRLGYQDPGAASSAPGRAPRALAPVAGEGFRSGDHAEAAPEVHSVRAAGRDDGSSETSVSPSGRPHAPQDWADELSGIRTGLALDDATEVLSAVPDPIPASAWEYRLAEWQATQEKWLDGKRAELAEFSRSRGIELHPVQMEA